MVNIFALKACVSFAQIGWTIIRVQSEWTVWLPDDTEWVYCQRILRHWFEGQEFWIILISSKRSACMLKMYIILSNLGQCYWTFPVKFIFKMYPSLFFWFEISFVWTRVLLFAPCHNFRYPFCFSSSTSKPHMKSEDMNEISLTHPRCPFTDTIVCSISPLIVRLRYMLHIRLTAPIKNSSFEVPTKLIAYIQRRSYRKNADENTFILH